ncbi:MAG TPA: DUF58 domain-containing protein [Prosthecobacter sp.]
MTPLADTDAWQRLYAQARSWAKMLRLPFRQQRWRGHAGEFTGTGVGSSLDFQDHRVYLPGDDPRQINWQAYARTGTYTMKLYREEVRPLVDLVLDVSGSMFAFPAKQQRSLELFAYAVEAGLQSGASLRCYAVRGGQHCLLDTELVVSGRWMQKAEGLPASAEVPGLARLPFRAAAMRVFISDLLFPGEPDRLLGPLSQGNGRGVLLAPYAVEESAPDWEGNHEFEDPETGGLQEHRIEPEILKNYRHAYSRHFQLWKTAAARHGVSMARISAETEFVSALRAEGLVAGAVEVSV